MIHLISRASVNINTQRNTQDAKVAWQPCSYAMLANQQTMTVEMTMTT